MMSAFVSKGARVVAIGPDPEEKWEEKFADTGIVYRSVPISRNGLSIKDDLKTYRSLKRIIRQEHPDKIFTYQAKSIVYGTLAAHSVDKSIEVYSLVAGLGSIFRGKGLKNKLIKTILSTQYRLAFRYSKRVIFQNNDDRNELMSHGLLDEIKTEIVHGSGVNTDKFNQCDFPDRKAVLFIGRLIRDKGISEYLELAKRLKQKETGIRCLLVGPYDSNPSAITEEELRPYIKEGIIEYFGEQSDVRPYIAECTVYVLPSYHEGTPKTVLEAMAMGRPIVTTDAPGCRETIIDGENGFLIPVKNIDELENSVMKIINDESLINRFGEKSREIALEKYDVNKVNDSIMKIMSI